MKYKVGDKVRVRDNLVVGEVYGGLDCLQPHKRECGKIFTISDSNECDYYLNGSNFWWSEEMLEDVEGVDIFVDGNKVIAKRGNKVGIAKCSPDDEFDIFTGAKLALERLEEKCKPYAWLKEGMVCYYPDFKDERLYIAHRFYGVDDKINERMKKQGLIFKTKEEAIEAAKKMLAVLKESDSNDED